MSQNQSYGKTKLSDNHKKQLATIGASIITVAVSAGNPLAIVGATLTAGESIYEFWKEKPENDLCKKLASDIEKIKNPYPEIINHDMIEGILSAAAKKIEEKATQNNLKPYRDDPDALFREIWQEMVHKESNTLIAADYYKDVLRVISRNIQVSENEMQTYLLAMPTDILKGVKFLLEESNREQTEALKQFIVDILAKREEPCTEKEAFSKADNQEYLARFYDPLFLEENDNSQVTLASMYVSPHRIRSEDTAAKCIMTWFCQNARKTCMLLFGNAGVGKSSLVSKIIADANQKGGAKREFDLTSDQVLAVALRNHCDKIDMNKKAGEILTDLFEGYTLDELKSKLLILDGLDEICVLRQDFDGFLFLNKLSQMQRGFHVLVTSREAKDYFSDPEGIIGLQIEHLQWTQDEVAQWCVKYSEAARNKEAWCTQFIQDFNLLNQNDLNREIFCVPIILYICGYSGINLTDHKSIGSIYKDAFQKILLRTHIQWEYGHVELVDADTESNLIAWQYTKELAYQMFLHDTLDLAESDDPENPHTKGLKNARLRTKAVMKEKHGIDVADNALDVKKELALCPFTKANGATGITFAHKTVYEYFTAVKLYEDYFANFDTVYFSSNSKEAAKAVIEAAVAAFRYNAIPEDIFHYLCEMHDAPFNGKEESTSESGLDVKQFTTAFVQAMEDSVLDKIAVTAPIPEYLTSQNTYNKCNTQITQAFRALLCFLTGQGFRNENGIAACKQICDMLFASDQIVNLEQWDLIGAWLQKAELQLAKLQGAKLQGAKLQGAQLQWAKLQEANLQRAKLQRAELQGANLQGAKLQRAELQEANLQGAELQEAELQWAKLQGAELQGANLLGANLQEAKLQGAKYCKVPYFKTVFPEGFNPKNHGMIEVDIDGNPVV